MKTLELIKTGWTRTFGTTGYPAGRRAVWALVLSLLPMSLAAGLALSHRVTENSPYPLWMAVGVGVSAAAAFVMFFAASFLATEGRGKWLSNGGPCFGCGQMVTSTDVGTLAEARRIRGLMKEHRAKLKAARKAAPHVQLHRPHG